PERVGRELERLHSKRDADDRQAHQDTRDHVLDREPDARQHQPEHVQEGPHAATLRGELAVVERANDVVVHADPWCAQDAAQVGALRGCAYEARTVQLPGNVIARTLHSPQGSITVALQSGRRSFYGRKVCFAGDRGVRTVATARRRRGLLTLVAGSDERG